MSPAAKVRELLLDDDALRKILVSLFGVVFAFISFEYHRITGEIDTRLHTIEGQLQQHDTGNAAKTERLITLENNVSRLKDDIGRLSGDIKNLGEKIDKLVHQLYEKK